MRPALHLIGREPELAAFAAAAADVAAGHGRCVLVTGEAGVGKTRLVADAIAATGLPCFTGAARTSVTQPYEPLAQVLRDGLRRVPSLPEACGPFAPYLAALLPELGPAADDVPEGALLEALRRAFAEIGSGGPAAIVLEDLQWASEALLVLLPQLAAGVSDLPLLLVGIVRDEVPADAHRLRLLRAQLRRICAPTELPLKPLDREATETLAAAAAGTELDPELLAALYDRSQGIPFYVEELAATLALQGARPDGRLPLPETVLDAVLLRTDTLSRAARNVLETAAVAGHSCELDRVPGLRRDEVLAEVLEAGFLAETAPGVVAFRHALVHDAVYQAIPWTRRQSLHATLARSLEAAGAPAGERATHWLGAGDAEHARGALIEAAEAAESVHAYRDASRLYERVLDLGGGPAAGRFDLLERLAVCAERAGDLATSARAWREVIDGRRSHGDVRRMAAGQHALGRVLALRGSFTRALDAWFAAAEGFTACAQPADAARARMAAAEVLSLTGSVRPALNAVRMALAECGGGVSPELEARARILEAVQLGKLGETDQALAAVQVALTEALTAGRAPEAAYAYQGLATVYENAGQFGRADEAYHVAIDYCASTGVEQIATECSACLSHVLRQRGEWRRSLALCRSLLENPATDDVSRLVANAVASQIHASRGERRPARRHVLEAVPVARQLRMIGPEAECAWTLARLELLEDAPETALDHCRELLRRFEETDDRHYALNALGWAAAVFASQHQRDELRRTVAALASIADENGNPEALAILAGGLGQVAREAGDAEEAAAHFQRAIDLFRDVELPHDRAELLVTAAQAALEAGQEQLARTWLTDARQQARRLGARPLQALAEQQLAALDAGPETAELAAGLTARQLQVVRLVAAGRTNREIAAELYLSVRTVDMHVRNALAALGCRSRVDAVRRANELGLLASA